MNAGLMSVQNCAFLVERDRGAAEIYLLYFFIAEIEEIELTVGRT
jgi:hypothetical protein